MSGMMHCGSWVADPSLAPLGRRKIEIAQNDMPGLMNLRRGEAGLLRGARIAVAMSITIETAVLVETLAALGGHVRVCSSNPLTIQDEAAAALAIGTDPPLGEGTPPQGEGTSGTIYGNW
eukprot:sb/3476245/